LEIDLENLKGDDNQSKSRQDEMMRQLKNAEEKVTEETEEGFLNIIEMKAEK
jgi:hypothetical protein